MDKFTRTANSILSENVYIFSDEENENEDLKAQIIQLLTQGKRDEATKILMSLRNKDPQKFELFIKEFEEESIPNEEESLPDRARKIDALAGAMDLANKLGATPRKRALGFVSGQAQLGKEVDRLMSDIATQIKGFRKDLK